MIHLYQRTRTVQAVHRPSAVHPVNRGDVPGGSRRNQRQQQRKEEEREKSRRLLGGCTPATIGAWPRSRGGNAGGRSRRLHGRPVEAEAPGRIREGRKSRLAEEADPPSPLRRSFRAVDQGAGRETQAAHAIITTDTSRPVSRRSDRRISAPCPSLYCPEEGRMAERRAEETTSLREVAEEDPVAHRVEDLRQAARAAEGTARVALPQAPGGAVAADEEDGAAGEDEDVVDEAVVAEEEEEQRRPKGRSNRWPPAAANCPRWIWPMPPHGKCRTQEDSAAWPFQEADCASIDRSLVDRRGARRQRLFLMAILQCSSSRWTDTTSI